jgi:hypothetical protein
MRFILAYIVLFFLIPESFAGYQKDTLVQKLDSINISSINDGQLINKDTFNDKKSTRDSLTFQFLKPEKSRPNLYFEYLVQHFFVKDKSLLHPARSIKVRKINYGLGNPINQQPTWLFISIILLIGAFVAVKVVFKSQLTIVLRAFYDTKVFHQLSKEDHILASWPYIFLYLIFSFSVGILISLILIQTNNINLKIDFTTFLLISLFVFFVCSAKILVLRLLGYFFRLQKLEKEYIKIIYLTYFNVLFFLLPIIFWLSLVDIRGQQIIFWTITSLSILIIGFQLIRNTVNILLNFRLSIFYLILYLCALEICPILVLARTIHTSFFDYGN